MPSNNNSEFVQSMKFLFPETSGILTEIAEDYFSNSKSPIFELTFSQQIWDREQGISNLKRQMLFEGLTSPETFQKISSHKSQLEFLKQKPASLNNFFVIDFSNDSLKDSLLKRVLPNLDEPNFNVGLVDEYIWIHRNNGVKFFPVYIHDYSSVVSAYWKMRDEISKNIDKQLKEKDSIIPLSYQMSVAGILPQFLHLDSGGTSSSPWEKVIDLCLNYGFESIRNQEKIGEIPDRSPFAIVLLGYNDRVKIDLHLYKKPDRKKLKLFSPKEPTSYSFEVRQ